MRLSPLVVLVLLGGCNLYFGHNGDDDCFIADDVAPAQELRNPETGQCEGFGGGGWGCDNPCEPCPLDDVGAAEAQPDWGSCFSDCEWLDEGTCIVTPRCHASYVDFVGEDGTGKRFFQGCWAIAPSGPDPGGCANLDAYGCSRHDNCSMVYTDGSKFEQCIPEGGGSCTSSADCGPGSHCTTDDGDCQPPPGCDPTTGMDCPAVCTGVCVPDGGDVCANIDCGPGAHCEPQCYPCDQPFPDGSCDKKCEPVCVPDQGCDNTVCPDGTTCVQVCGMGPGGCAECHTECQPSTSCEALADEGSCLSRSDCRAVYKGDDCTCDAAGNCSCNILTYARCETP
jgi:hypothetical protein